MNAPQTAIADVAATLSPQVGALQADFGGQIASPDAKRMASWTAASADNQGLPFIIIDKVRARVFVFNDRARIEGSAPALLGLALGDGTTAGVGQRPLAAIGADERTTPAGRFVASLGHDYT